MDELFWFAAGCVLLAALASVAVALVVLAVDWVLGARLAPGVRALLWLLVAARLMMPAAPGSTVSVQRAWDLLEPAATSPSLAEFIAAEPAAGQLTQDLIGAVAESDPLASSHGPADPLPERQLATSAAGIDWIEAALACLMMVWLGGATAVLARSTIASARFARSVHRRPAETSEHVIDVVLHACDEIGVRRPRIKRIPGLGAPALFGLWRPTLCLPDNCRLTPEELRLIALHEAAHIKRRDCAVAWLLTPVRALHWCNPIAWLTVRRYERYREQACDEAVLNRADERLGRVYAELLLRFASADPAPSPGLVGLWFARSKSELSDRIRGLDVPIKRRMPRAVAILLLALVAAASLTDAVATSTNVSPVPQPQRPSPFGWSIQPSTTADSGQSTLQTYDLTDAITRAKEVHPESDPRARLLSYLIPLNAKHRVSSDDPNTVTVRGQEAVHKFFRDALDDYQQFGHTWKVVVSTRVIGSSSIDDLQGVDWTRSVAFPSAEAPPQSPLELNNDLAAPLAADLNTPQAGADGLRLSTNSITVDYLPFLAAQVDESTTTRLIEKWQADPRRSLRGGSAPKATLFNGQQAVVRDQSYMPFVVGVDYIRGEFATAAQPHIAVLSEGAVVEVLPRVLSDDTLDLTCRLLLSHIDDGGTALLPGQDVAVQTPRATTKTLTARSRMSKGDTLLMAPLTVAASNKETPADQRFYWAVTVDWLPDPPATESLPADSP